MNNLLKNLNSKFYLQHKLSFNSYRLQRNISSASFLSNLDTISSSVVLRNSPANLDNNLHNKCVLRCLTTSPFEYTKYVPIKGFVDTEKKIDDLNEYFNKSLPFITLINDLDSLSDKDAYIKYTKPILKKCYNDLYSNNLDNLCNTIETNKNKLQGIKNNFGYLKYEICQTNLLSCYLIIWLEDAETAVHYHASNGCFIQNLFGTWNEHIYEQDFKTIKLSREINGGDLCFINNSIGPHKVKFMNKINDFGLSINIYSPTCEL